jgi:hypothetical protein
MPHKLVVSVARQWSRQALGLVILKRARLELPLHKAFNRSLMIDPGGMAVRSSDVILDQQSHNHKFNLSVRVRCTRNEAYTGSCKPCFPFYRAAQQDRVEVTGICNVIVLPPMYRRQ